MRKKAPKNTALEGLTVYFKDQIATDRRWCERAILRIYKGQMSDAKQNRAEGEHLGIGFSRIDNEIMSSFAEQLERGWILSDAQIKTAQKIMPKYAKQLAKFVMKSETLHA